ncbi:MAG: nitrilase-related carbon-nitrogen hydrolase, partial [Planctomycetota bacterium]
MTRPTRLPGVAAVTELRIRPSGSKMAQHLQAASFRSIENRIPTARSVNNGVSAIIDPDGRIRSSVTAATPGSLVGRVMLDDRTAPYGVIGDI